MFVRSLTAWCMLTVAMSWLATSAHAEVMCAKNKNGKVRMAAVCKRNEHQVTHNPREVAVSTTSTTVSSCDLVDLGIGLGAGFYTAAVTCPAGSRLTGGGGECSIVDGGDVLAGVGLFLSEAIPDSNGSLWWVVGCDTLALGGLVPVLCASATCAKTFVTQ
jgi:hypothetical protein